MEDTKIFKALSNQTRVQILDWLKNPEKNFEPQTHSLTTANFEGGVCVASIQKKVDLSQSTVSNFLSMLHKSGLLEAKKIGQWTYYRRNEETIRKLSKWIKEEL
ncbi:ArsR/SmtB family transcription factor [Niallia taxi]|uniref:ArsR/SmtB family transcription factor n=1 Tax=Niallia taxi TaxID=2499688 RepID=UPI00300935D6